MCFFAKPLNHSKAEGDLNIMEMENLHNKRAINHEKQLGLYHNKVTSSQNPIQGFYDKKKTENGPHTQNWLANKVWELTVLLSSYRSARSVT